MIRLTWSTLVRSEPKMELSQSFRWARHFVQGRLSRRPLLPRKYWQIGDPLNGILSALSGPQYIMEKIKEGTVSLTVADLARRWKLAREAAFCAATKLRKNEDDFLSGLNKVDDEKFEDLLKAVFLNSRNLGRGYQKNHGLVWELSDLYLYITKLGSPCLKGQWLQKEDSITLTRPGCRQGTELGARFCQYWREAVDGLVMGVCDEERYARHDSVNAGSTQCVDVFFVDRVDRQKAIWSSPFRWGPLPETIQTATDEVVATFKDMKVDLKFLGVSEKQLFYKMETKQASQSCGTTGTILRTHLQNLIKQRCPDLVLRDASPLAVYGEKT